MLLCARGLCGGSVSPVFTPQEEKLKEYRREQKKARKRKEKDEEEDLEAEVDPEMEAMMGFSGFGAKKKKA